MQPPSLSVAPTSPGPADQIRMIFGTDSDPDSAEDNPNTSSNNSASNSHQHLHPTHNQVNMMAAATTTVQLPQQQHSPQPQILWH